MECHLMYINDLSSSVGSNSILYVDDNTFLNISKYIKDLDKTSKKKKKKTRNGAINWLE